MRPAVAVVSFCVVALCAASAARADIYRYVDHDGVVHFTNIRPRGKERHRWRRVLRERARTGKASARRGACAGCDVVPARDTSKARFTRYNAYIYEASALYHIPVALIRAIIRVESDYDPRVVSSAGARGLMQLMPAVVRSMGVRDVRDPRENILGGTRFLRLLANRYRGDLVRTIAAYNAGPGSLAKYGGEVPPYRTTRRYVRLVLDRYYRNLREERRGSH